MISDVAKILIQIKIMHIEHEIKCRVRTGKTREYGQDRSGNPL